MRIISGYYRGRRIVPPTNLPVHNKKPWLYVYSFEDSPQLRQAMESYVPDEMPGERGNRI